MGTLLEARQVVKDFGGLRAVDHCSIAVERGSICGLIGPNGAGKSTLLKTIFGFVDLHRGKIFYDGKEITGLRPEEISERGVAYVPQESDIFPSLTVLENLEMDAILNEKSARARLNHVFDKFPRLQERRGQSAGTLSGGERQMLAMGCGLMIEPQLMLLDEITGGLAPILVAGLFEAVRGIHREGTSILMVEQSAKKALEVSQRGYILEGGKIKLEGPAKELLRNEEVIKHYLGV